MKLSKVKYLLSVIISTGLLAGCSSKISYMHPSDMLRIDVGSEAPTLDPTLADDSSSTRITFDLFAGLVDFTQQNQVIPGMAQSWDISPDGKTYTFHLRQGLKFSDGTPITASDFVYSWQRLVNPKTASDYNFLLQNVVNGQAIIDGKLAPTTLGVAAPNPDTFVVTLVYPDPVFIKSLILSNVAVVPKHVIEKYGSKWTDPKYMVTSGAYMLKEHVVNGYILAVKNPYYYDAAHVSIPKIKYYPFVDTNTSLSSYKSGGLDMTFQTVPVDQYKEIKRTLASQLHTVNQEAIYYYDFNFKIPELANDLNLRKALSMAIDRKALVDRILGSGEVALYSTVTPTIEDGKYEDLHYAWESWPREEQIKEARRLYKLAGYSKNHELQITSSYNTNDQHKKIALSIAAMWHAILGVNAKVENEEWKTFIQARHNGNFEIARDGWMADYDSVTSYTPLYQCGNGQNNSHYCNPKYNQLLKQAAATTDDKLSSQLYKEALAIPLNDYAVIPLFQYTYQRLVKPYVKGYQIDTNYLDHVQSKWFSISKLPSGEMVIK